MLNLQRLQGGQPIVSSIHLKAGLPENFGVELPHIRLVFNHEDSLRWVCSTLKRGLGRTSSHSSLGILSPLHKNLSYSRNPKTTSAFPHFAYKCPAYQSSAGLA